MRRLPTFPAIVMLMLFPAAATAEGLIHQLPEDGAWVRFDVRGEGIASDGTVTTTLKGTYTVSSVGKSTVKDEKCRWIELDVQLKFARNGREGEFSEVLKLLIPEKHLTKGHNPRDHVVKAYKKDSKGAIRELDLKGQGAREIQSLDEFFHSPLKHRTKMEAIIIDTKLGKLKCEGWKGRESQSAGQSETVFTTETLLHKKAPFGVVTFRYEKERKRNGQPGQKRNSILKLVDFGKNAKSVLPDSQ